MEEVAQQNNVNIYEDEHVDWGDLGRAAAMSSSSRGTKRRGGWGGNRGGKRFKGVRKTKSKKSPKTSHGRNGGSNFKSCPFPNI